jgi:hypothetical protein
MCRLCEPGGGGARGLGSRQPRRRSSTAAGAMTHVKRCSLRVCLGVVHCAPEPIASRCQNHNYPRSMQSQAPTFDQPQQDLYYFLGRVLAVIYVLHRCGNNCPCMVYCASLGSHQGCAGSNSDAWARASAFVLWQSGRSPAQRHHYCCKHLMPRQVSNSTGCQGTVRLALFKVSRDGIIRVGGSVSGHTPLRSCSWGNVIVESSKPPAHTGWLVQRDVKHHSTEQTNGVRLAGVQAAPAVHKSAMGLPSGTIHAISS